MSNYFQTEYSDKQTSSILIVGYHPLVPGLIQQLASAFKIITFFKKAEFKIDNLSKNVEALDNLKEEYFVNRDIGCAIFFLDQISDVKNLFSLTKILKKTNTKVLVVLNLRNLYEHLKTIYSFEKSNNLIFILLGDLYGKSIHSEYNQLTKFIDIAISNETIVLTGNDLYSLFPISDEDAVQAIIQVMLTSKNKKNAYCIFYEHPQTYISLTQLLKNIIPSIEIQYVNEKNFEEKDFDLNNAMGDLKGKTGIVSKLVKFPSQSFEKSIKVIQSLNGSSSRSPLLPSRTKVHSQKKYKLVIALVVFYFLLLFFSVGLSLFFFQKSISDLKKEEIQAFQSSTSISYAFLSISTPFLDPIFYSIASLREDDNLMSNYDSLKSILGIFDEVSGLITTARVEQDNIVSGKKLFTQLGKINDIYFKLEKLKAENDYIRAEIEKYAHIKYQDYILLAQLLPEILAYKTEKKYLILFQNNAELRPTGGFIGSIGELSVSNGKAKQFSIQDVYEIDGQLKAHVEPHFIIRRYLQPHLYLRDSNFNPDFERSANTSALLYKLSTQKEVNGVVGVDFEVIKETIKLLGPITLADYKTTLDHDNILDFLHNTIESNFFPGSSQKKELLQSLYNQLMFKISEKKENYYKLFSLVPRLVQEKHIMFASNNKEHQNIFRLTNISGSYQDLREKKENVTYDFLTINEANIGVNKANQYVQRKVNYDIKLTDTGITSKATVTLTNKGEKTSPYTSYLRIFTPLGSSLESISIDQKAVQIVPSVTDFRIYEDKKFKKQDGLEVDSSVENGKQVFGFIITVPKDSEQVIEVSYRNGLTIPNDKLFTYDLLYIKQPGTLQYPLELNLDYGDSYQVKNLSNGSIEDNRVVVKDKISFDARYAVDFEKK